MPVAIENDEIAKVLEETADMLEVAGENFFRVRAYRNAARAIRDQSARVADLTLEQIDEIPGIGADLAEKIRTVAETGEMPLHHRLAAKFPPRLLELRDVPGLGPKRLKTLIDRLRIRDRDDLEKALKADKLSKIPGFGPKMIQQIRQALMRPASAQPRRVPYPEAAAIAGRLRAYLQRLPAIKELAVAGS